jgi:hypothetical protein
MGWLKLTTTNNHVKIGIYHNQQQWGGEDLPQSTTMGRGGYTTTNNPWKVRNFHNHQSWDSKH